MNTPLRVPLSPTPSQQEAGQRPASPTSPSASVLMFGAISLVALLAMLYLVSRNLSSMAASTACPSTAAWTQAILAQERAGQWSVAASNADVALQTPGLCKEDRQAFTESAVMDGLEVLYGTTFDPSNVSLQQFEVQRYHDLQRRAQVNVVAFPSSVQVGQRAYSLGQYLLAVNAFEDAMQHGQVPAHLLTIAQQYVSALYTQGYAWASQADDETRSQGLRLLATGERLAACMRWPSNPAQEALVQLVGSNQRLWPAVRPSPFLAWCLAGPHASPHRSSGPRRRHHG